MGESWVEAKHVIHPRETPPLAGRGSVFANAKRGELDSLEKVIHPFIQNVGFSSF